MVDTRNVGSEANREAVRMLALHMAEAGREARRHGYTEDAARFEADVAALEGIWARWSRFAWFATDPRD